MNSIAVSSVLRMRENRCSTSSYFGHQKDIITNVNLSDGKSQFEEWCKSCHLWHFCNHDIPRDVFKQTIPNLEFFEKFQSRFLNGNSSLGGDETLNQRSSDCYNVSNFVYEEPVKLSPTPKKQKCEIQFKVVAPEFNRFDSGIREDLQDVKLLIPQDNFANEKCDANQRILESVKNENKLIAASLYDIICICVDMIDLDGTTKSNYIDRWLSDLIFLLYRWYTGPCQLFDLIQKLYEENFNLCVSCLKRDICDNEVTTLYNTQCLIHFYTIKLCQVLRFWFKSHPYDLEHNPRLRRKLNLLKERIANDWGDGNYPYQLIQLNHLDYDRDGKETLKVGRSKSVKPNNFIASWLDTDMGESISSETINTAKNGLSNVNHETQRNDNFYKRRISLAFNSIEPNVLAIHLTYLDLQESQKITIEELHKYAIFTDLSKCPNLRSSIAFFNSLSHWIQCMILNKSLPSERAKVITKFVEVSKTLYEINSFNALMAIVGGLLHSSIGRLTRTMAQVPIDTLMTLSNLANLLSTSNNFKSYRTKLKQVQLNVPVATDLSAAKKPSLVERKRSLSPRNLSFQRDSSCKTNSWVLSKSWFTPNLGGLERVRIRTLHSSWPMDLPGDKEITKKYEINNIDKPKDKSIILINEDSSFRIPIWGIYLKDIVSIHATHPDYLFDPRAKLINLPKLKKLKPICEELSRLKKCHTNNLNSLKQEHCFPYMVDMDLVNMLRLSLDMQFSEEEIYELSIARESRQINESISEPTINSGIQTLPSEDNASVLIQLNQPLISSETATGKDLMNKVAKFHTAGHQVFAEWASGIKPAPDWETLNQHIDAMVDAVFKNYDSDRDGYISRHEFGSISENFPFIDSFVDLDTDKDGVISRKELRSYFYRANCHTFRIGFKHEFRETTYFKLTFCEFCLGLLWGLFKQGYRCKDCGVNVHKSCKDVIVIECRPKPINDRVSKTNPYRSLSFAGSDGKRQSHNSMISKDPHSEILVHNYGDRIVQTSGENNETNKISRFPGDMNLFSDEEQSIQLDYNSEILTRGLNNTFDNIRRSNRRVRKRGRTQLISGRRNILSFNENQNFGFLVKSMYTKLDQRHPGFLATKKADKDAKFNRLLANIIDKENFSDNILAERYDVNGRKVLLPTVQESTNNSTKTSPKSPRKFSGSCMALCGENYFNKIDHQNVRNVQKTELDPMATTERMSKRVPIEPIFECESVAQPASTPSRLFRKQKRFDYPKMYTFKNILPINQTTGADYELDPKKDKISLKEFKCENGLRETFPGVEILRIKPQDLVDEEVIDLRGIGGKSSTRDSFKNLMLQHNLKSTQTDIEVKDKLSTTKVKPNKNTLQRITNAVRENTTIVNSERSIGTQTELILNTETSTYSTDSASAVNEQIDEPVNNIAITDLEKENTNKNKNKNEPKPQINRKLNDNSTLKKQFSFSLPAQFLGRKFPSINQKVNAKKSNTKSLVSSSEVDKDERKYLLQSKNKQFSQEGTTCKKDWQQSTWFKRSPETRSVSTEKGDSKMNKKHLSTLTGKWKSFLSHIPTSSAVIETCQPSEILSCKGKNTATAPKKGFLEMVSTHVKFKDNPSPRLIDSQFYEIVENASNNRTGKGD